MADSFIALPTDATNTGKKRRTQTRTVNAVEVHSTYEHVSDESTGLAAKVVSDTPASDAAGIVVRQAGAVSVSNLPSTQAVSGSVSVANFPASTAVTGTFFQATQPVSLATAPTTPVTGTFWQTTQPVSIATMPTTAVTGPLTDAQLRAAAVPVSMATTNVATYTSAVKFAPAVTVSKDFWTITGSATKTVKVRRIWISGTSTAAQIADLALVRRSTAYTGGTSTAPAIVASDSASVAATAVVRAYTAVATEGTLVGTIWQGVSYLGIATATATSMVQPVLVIDFDADGRQPLVLRGVAQSLALQVTTALGAGPSLRVAVEFTEE